LIYLYPANKMENLLVLLDKIQQLAPLPVFTQETIIVQNAGMQHWLNLSLAKQRGISMNTSYALPAQFLWKLVRTLASEEEVPEQSPYSREVLSWRIYALLASKEVIEDDDFLLASQYWRGKRAQENNAEQANIKRYQLACQLADLYEQYLIFRPEWIDAWHKGENSIDLTDDSDTNSQEKWQAKLWRLLIKEQAYNPVSLMKKAISNIEHHLDAIPPRISFFGINAMAPIWLDLIHALSEHIEVHFFHLNPCYAYWGDLVSEKQAINSMASWVKGVTDFKELVGNPLLANLGQQGREFMAMLHNYSTINIDVFEQLPINDTSAGGASVLARVQHDILTLTDARNDPIEQRDDSIVITSCHSALREVQGVHDWLLHRFNQDSSLTPKDVLVMCPQIENYAPYVNAVFTRGWQDIDDKVPPLPCSIADRSSIDADPLIAAFCDILNLPDSRFQVSQFVALLRIPEMQKRFDIGLEELEKIMVWLEQACIHWGLDKAHKERLLSSTGLSDSFTWQQGFSRLMRGFAFGDHQSIYQDQLLLPTIEGADAILLGKLMLIIEQMQQYAAELVTERTAKDWQLFLYRLIEDLFVVDSDASFNAIHNAIAALVEYCGHAGFEQEIDLLVIRDFLNNHFSQPDPGRHFMVGQVTFCSMLPMRSIPFKVIAVLGLNDGEYPRQRQPLGFDLIDMTPGKLGDRSRRGDDRYLFLEAIISARQALYLSYQGRNIRTNTEQQASLVLKELVEYLELGYGWQLAEQGADLRQLPMQAFSIKNYQGKFASFDENWLRLAQKAVPTKEDEKHSATSFLIPEDSDKCELIQLEADQLIRYYQHPARYFAEHHLHLYLNQTGLELEDTEPFENDYLQSYLLRQELVAAGLAGDGPTETGRTSDMEQVLLAAKLSGRFPDLPTTSVAFERWQQEAKSFADVLNEHQVQDIEFYTCSLPLTVEDAEGQSRQVQLTAQLPLAKDKLVFYRSSTAKAKDVFSLYLSQLMLQLWQGKNISSGASESRQASELNQARGTSGFYFDTKSQKISHLAFSQLPEPEKQLTRLLKGYFTGQEQALLLNGELAEKIFKAKAFEQAEFEAYWSDQNVFMPFGEDPYIHYFWPECPMLDQHREELTDIYGPMYQSLNKQTVKTGSGH